MFHSRMKEIFFLLFFMLAFSLNAKKTGSSQIPQDWAETIVAIDQVEKLEDGSYAYRMQYNAPESTAVNAKGQKIMGPIDQYGRNEQKPVCPQKIKAMYWKEEPIIFEFLEPMQFE